MIDIQHFDSSRAILMHLINKESKQGFSIYVLNKEALETQNQHLIVRTDSVSRSIIETECENSSYFIVDPEKEVAWNAEIKNRDNGFYVTSRKIDSSKIEDLGDHSQAMLLNIRFDGEKHDNALRQDFANFVRDFEIERINRHSENVNNSRTGAFATVCSIISYPFVCIGNVFSPSRRSSE